MKIFDLSLKLNGFPIQKARQFLFEIQQIPEKNFKNYVNKAKRNIVNFHLSNNPFYKSIAKDIDSNHWNSVPVMTKLDLQQPLEKRLTKGFSKQKAYVNRTSGSSGDPFIFAKDKFSHALTWAEIQDRFGWYNIDFNKSKQARFYGIPLDRFGYYKERIKDFLSNRYRFSVFDLSDNAFEKHLDKFTNTKFNYINGYTSSIVQFAKFLKKNDIVLKQRCSSLNACIVTAEMLFDDDKKLMETHFGVPVINEYGASELDLIAFQNQQGEWQVNSETLYVEILDEKNNILPNGEKGRVVITSLYNKAHPFIRYDIGDIGVLSKTSTSKKPILQKLIGRTNDIAILPSGKKAAGLTFYYITKSIIEDDGKVKEFVIEQLSKNHFHVKYVSEELLSGEKTEIIKTEMENYLEDGLEITFERKTKLDRSNRGKLKQFSSYVEQ